jgi:hypothetical protein
MSKLQDRMPALSTREARQLTTRSVLGDVIKDGRVVKDDFVIAVEARLRQHAISEDVIQEEARKSIAEQLVSAWANEATIKLDRTQRVPVYQTQLGFAESFFKVGSVYVLPEAMTSQDFEVMLERYDRRIENATTDRAILADFYARAKPGLDAGQNLVVQFDAGTLELMGVNGDASLAAADETP